MLHAEEETQQQTTATKKEKKGKKENKMEGQQEEQNKAKVVKVDSVESWDLYFNQAINQGFPVSFLKLKLC